MSTVPALQPFVPLFPTGAAVPLAFQFIGSPASLAAGQMPQFRARASTSNACFTNSGDWCRRLPASMGDRAVGIPNLSAGMAVGNPTGGVAVGVQKMVRIPSRCRRRIIS